MRGFTLGCLAVVAAMLAGCGAGGGSSGEKPVRLSITTSGLPAGVIGISYSAQLSATGGDAPYTFGVVGALPPGLMLDTGTGAITGIPTAAFSGNVEFTLTDANPFTVNRLISMQVTTPPALSLTSTLGSGYTGSAFSGSVQAVGGVAPFTYSVSSGQLPPGLTLNANSGTVTGTPTTAGAYAVNFAVLDAANQQAGLPASIDIGQGVSLFTPTSLPDAYVGFDWYARIDASGGLPPYQFALSGAPGWVQAATKGDGWLELTGTPSTAGAIAFNVQVTDRLGSMGQAQYSATVGTPLTSTTGNSQVVTTALPRATVGDYCEFEVEGSGGIPIYYWSATGLPDGLYLDANVTNPAKLRGRPRAAGVYKVFLTANDSVHGANTSSVDLVVEPAIEALPDSTEGTEYLAVAGINTGGTGVALQPASATTSGGLGISVGSGIQLAGTPTTPGREVFAVQVSMGGKDVIQLVGTDVRTDPGALQIHTSQLPDAVAGSGYDYSAILQAEGGTGVGYQWSLISGTLPPGVTGLSGAGPAAAKLSGSTTQTGSYQFTVQVTDSASATAQANLTIDVVAPRKGDFNGDGCPDLLVGSEFSSSLGGLKLFYGESAQPRFGTISMEDADWTYSGTTTVCKFGDFNGDGISDIALNQAGTTTTPARIRIWFGSRTSPLYGTAGAPDCEITDQNTTDRLGSSMAAGDLDGDGYDDLVVGAAYADYNKTDAGAVYIFYGGSQKLAGGLTVAGADARLEASIAGTQNTYWGYSATGYLGDSLLVQDIDGDGRADIVAGASSVIYVKYATATRFAGAIALATSAEGVFSGNVGSDSIERLALGDFNGDGHTDLVVGGLNSYLYYGAATGLPLSGTSDAGVNAVEFTTPWISSTSLLVSVAALDLNADGIDDFIFTTPENAFGYMFYGNATKFTGVVDYSTADVTFNFGGNDYAPWFAARLDANNDGIDDLMLGVHNWTAYTANGPIYTAGGICIVNGSATAAPQGAVSPTAGNGLKLIGQLSNHGWGGCGCGG